MNASLSSSIELKILREIMNSTSRVNTPGEGRARYFLSMLSRITNVLMFSIFVYEGRFRETPASATGINCTLN
jgi:hypothetical protein